MALIKSVKGVIPQFGSNCFLAENATITGDVIMGDNCSVWFNTVIRGDVHTIRCLLYTSPSPRDRTRSRMPSSA